MAAKNLWKQYGCSHLLHGAVIFITRSGATFSWPIELHEAYYIVHAPFDIFEVQLLHVSWAMKWLTCVSKENCVRGIMFAGEEYSERWLRKEFPVTILLVLGARRLAKFEEIKSTNGLPKYGWPKRTLLCQDRFLQHIHLPIVTWHPWICSLNYLWISVTISA